MDLTPHLHQLTNALTRVFLFSVPFMLAEAFFPDRVFRLRPILLRDALHVVAAIALTLPTAGLVYTWIIFPLSDPGFFDLEPDLPLPLVLFLTLVGIDFTLYWIHRALHAPLLWRTHRWHHSPKQMYWFAGLRASFPHNFLFVANSLVWAFAMRVPPNWIATGTTAAILSNNWMHTNIRLR